MEPFFIIGVFNSFGMACASIVGAEDKALQKLPYFVERVAAVALKNFPLRNCNLAYGPWQSFIQVWDVFIHVAG